MMTGHNPQIKAVDFFCGGGGMSCGMKRAGIKIVAAVDNDPICQETYEANHPETTFILGDITKMDEVSFSEQAGIEKDDDNLLFIGCSPCQYWSVITGDEKSAKKKKAHKTRNLLRDFLRFVAYYRPGFILVENVCGIRKNPQESGLSDLREFLERDGYCFDEKVLVASDCGVPQTRRRYVLLASRVIKNIKLPKSKTKTTTVYDIIGDGKFPKINAGETDKKDPLHRAPKLSDKNIARLKMLKAGGTREKWAKNDDLLIDAYRDKPVSFFHENYGRMFWDRPGPTITTRFFAISCGRFGHPEQNRAISLREGAMLQTFPKNYKFKTKTYQKTAILIGNAVPPKLAYHIGKSLTRLASK